MTFLNSHTIHTKSWLVWLVCLSPLLWLGFFHLTSLSHSSSPSLSLLSPHLPLSLTPPPHLTTFPLTCLFPLPLLTCPTPTSLLPSEEIQIVPWRAWFFPQRSGGNTQLWHCKFWVLVTRTSWIQSFLHLHKTLSSRSIDFTYHPHCWRPSLLQAII